MSGPAIFSQQPGQYAAGTDSQLNWLLDDLVARVAHLKKAAFLSRDGLAIGTSTSLSREDSEHLAAIAAGMQSLARGSAEHFGLGRVYQTVIEMEGGFLFVTAAGAGSCLALLATPEADAGLIAYEMALMVKRVGQHMAVARRPAPGVGEAV